MTAAPTLPGLEHPTPPTPAEPTIPTSLPTGLRPGGPTKPGTCRCGATILAGYDSHTLAHLAVVDPYRLTPQLDAAAHILDRPTWVLHGRPGQYELAPRTWPGVPNTWPVETTTEALIVTAHECNSPLGGTLIPLTNDTHSLPPDSEPEF